jgi:MipA family protein
MLSRQTLASAGLVTSLLAGGACAQAFDAVRLEGDDRQDSGRIGLAAIAGTKYLGSDERRYMAFPSIDYRWANGWFAGLGNGVGYRWKANAELQYGVRLTADFGRKESRSSALNGLGDIDARPEAGVFFNWAPSHSLMFSSSMRYGSGNDRDGLVLDLGMHTGIPLAMQWRLGLGLSATFANREYMQSYFGITPEQSGRSGYAVYEPGAGLRDIRLGSSLTYIINRDWAATLAVSASSLQGDAKDSPIVRERHPVTGVLAIGYRF